MYKRTDWRKVEVLPDEEPIQENVVKVRESNLVHINYQNKDGDIQQIRDGNGNMILEVRVNGNLGGFAIYVDNDFDIEPVLDDLGRRCLLPIKKK